MFHDHPGRCGKSPLRGHKPTVAIESTQFMAKIKFKSLSETLVVKNTELEESTRSGSMTVEVRIPI